MHLLKTNAEARKLLETIPHKSCCKGMAANWRVQPDGRVSAQSVLWLFCWAKTGMNSQNARLASVEVFDQILPLRFSDLDSASFHAYARAGRYALGDIEGEFERQIQKPEQ